MFSPCPSSPNPTPAVYDRAIGADELSQLRREFPGEGLSEVVDMFEEEGRLRLDQLALALARLDGAALRRAAHGLRGAGGNFGARSLDAICGEIEFSARGEDFARVTGLLDGARIEYRRVLLALQQECRSDFSS